MFCSYKPTSPRDLFNQAKLLKCLGQLALFIVDEKYPELVGGLIVDPKYGYKVKQDVSSGDISVTNLKMFCGGKRLRLFCSLNNRSPWPLECYDCESGVCFEVFYQSQTSDSEVVLSDEFLSF